MTRKPSAKRSTAQRPVYVCWVCNSFATPVHRKLTEHMRSSHYKCGWCGGKSLMATWDEYVLHTIFQHFGEMLLWT